MTRIVLVIEPTNPTIGKVIISFRPEFLIFIFLSAIHNQPATTPMRTRQPMAIQRAFSMPNAPVVLRNGENANDKSVGDVVLLITEQIPNTAPRIAPAAGPRRIAPMMTGMCTVVALIIGSCIIPIGVLANKMTMAAISATWDM